MVYTSYFASKKYNPKDGISIARYAKFWDGETCAELFPSEELLRDYKAGLVSEEEYKERYYNETLINVDPVELADRLRDRVLLCYEKTGDFCHRHIVAEWFMKNGILCEEL